MALVFTKVRTEHGSSLVADVNSGVLCVNPRYDRQLTVVDGWVRSTGTADTCTSVDFGDGTTSAIAFNVAGLADATVLRAGAANTVVTNMGTALLKNKGIYLKTVGAGIGTATAIEWCVKYLVSNTES